MLQGCLRYPLVFLLFYSALPAAPVRAQSQSQCKDMEEIQALGCTDERRLGCGVQKYDLGFFSDAITLLGGCLTELKNNNRRELAYRTVALAYYELGEEESSEVWIRRLMKLDRNYRAYPDDPTFFKESVITFRPQAWYEKRWVQVGGLSVLSGVAGFFLLRKSPGPTPLPLAPGFPPN